VSQVLIAAGTADEQEYERAVAEAATRRRRLVALRAELDGLRRGLVRFEAACHARVGDLMAELRRVQRSIADHQRRLDRLDDEEEPELLDDEEGAPEDDGARYSPFGTNGRERPEPPGDGRRPGRLARGGREAEAEAKRLYRGLAKRCHPDFARDDEERRRRVGLMQQVNEAYRARDLPTLRRLHREAEAADPAFARRPLAERLAWVRADLLRLEAEAADLRAEIAALRATEAYRLWRRHEAGEPVFEALEDDLEKRLVAEGRRLDRLVVALRTALDERRAEAAAPVA
jgi:hypothetical protein